MSKKEPEEKIGRSVAKNTWSNMVVRVGDFNLERMDVAGNPLPDRL